MEQRIVEMDVAPVEDDPGDGVSCPSLVLSAEIICDKDDILLAPMRSHLWEYCITGRYPCCPRRQSCLSL